MKFKFYYRHTLILIFFISFPILIFGQDYRGLTSSDDQAIEILKTQINAVQRAIIAYDRINPPYLLPPTINNLVLEDYLPISNDISFRDGVFRLYHLWEGEITILSDSRLHYIQAARLPYIICRRVLPELQRTSPYASCQGEMNDPLNWQLRIPVRRVRLFQSHDFKIIFR